MPENQCLALFSLVFVDVVVTISVMKHDLTIATVGAVQ